MGTEIIIGLAGVGAASILGFVGYIFKRDYDEKHEQHLLEQQEQKEFRRFCYEMFEKINSKINDLTVNLARNCEQTTAIKERVERDGK